MTIPSLFLRASEVGKARGPGESVVNDPANHTAAADLLVPRIRPGLEFVLEGEEQALCRKCRGSGCEFCCNGMERMEVRAFEIIAGEPGRVIDGTLEKLHAESGRWQPLTDLALHSPWREAWARITSLSDEFHGFSRENGPVWLVGPSVRRNFYKLTRHELRRPQELTADLAYEPGLGVESYFAVCKLLLQTRFGIEWRLGDEPVARVMRSGFGL